MQMTRILSKLRKFFVGILFIGNENDVLSMFVFYSAGTKNCVPQLFTATAARSRQNQRERSCKLSVFLVHSLRD